MLFLDITWLLPVWIYVLVLACTRSPPEQAIHNYRRDRRETQETLLLTEKILPVCHYIMGDDHFKGAYALVNDFTSMNMWVALIRLSGLLLFLKKKNIWNF